MPIPANLVTPLAGVTATLLNFSTSVSGTAKGLPYIGIKGCSGGKLKFKGTFALHRRNEQDGHGHGRLQEVALDTVEDVGLEGRGRAIGPPPTLPVVLESAP